METTAETLLNEGRLAEALELVQARAVQDPADAGNQFLRFELLVLEEALDEATAALMALPDSFAQAKAHYGGLLAAEKQRRAVMLRGQGAPGFLARPPEHVHVHFSALRELIAGEGEVAQRRLADLSLPALSGTLDGTPFRGIRDCDDLLAPVLEFMVPGSYGWLPLLQIRSLTLLPPQGYPDVIWIPARVTLHDQDGEQLVRIPSLYVGTGTRSDSEKLGLETRWERPLEGISRAFGQRDLLVEGEDGERSLYGIRNISELVLFDPAVS